MHSSLMTKFILILALLGCLLVATNSHAQENYLDYHLKIIECEQLIIDGKSSAAIEVFDSLFHQFNFLFLRVIKVATEVSVFEKDFKSAMKFARLGLKAGWTLQSIKRSDNLQSLKEYSEWEKIVSAYDSLHRTYISRQIHRSKNKSMKCLKRIRKRHLGHFSESVKSLKKVF